MEELGESLILLSVPVLFAGISRMLRVTDPRSGARLGEARQHPINPNANKPDRHCIFYITDAFGSFWEESTIRDSRKVSRDFRSRFDCQSP